MGAVSCAGFGRPVTHPVEVGSKARERGRVTVRWGTFDAGPGRPVGPPLDLAAGEQGERGSDEPSGWREWASWWGVPVFAADPEDDRDGDEPGDDTGDEVEGHDAALLTLVGWLMR